MKKFIYTEIKKSSGEQTEQEAVACYDCAIQYELVHAPHLDKHLIECNSNLECEFHEEDQAGR
jgi:hypothetical protein